MRRSERQLLAMAMAFVGAITGGCALQRWSGERIGGKVDAHNERRQPESWKPWEDRLVAGAPAREFPSPRVAALFSGASQLRLTPVGGNFRLSGKMSSSGTASAVTGDGYYLTAAHCVGDSPLTLVGWDSQNRLVLAQARVVWKGDPETVDLAVLKVPMRPKFFALGDPAALPERASVFTAGYGRQRAHLSGGHLVSVGPPQRNDAGAAWRHVIHSAPMIRGHSGGPVMDENGRLLAIMSAVEVDFFQLPFLPLLNTREIAISPDHAWLRRLIDADRRKNSTRR